MASKKPKPVRLSEIGREFPSDQEFIQYLDRLETIDGRAAALSHASFLEAQLERAIALQFQLHDARHYDDIFIASGAPLNSFSAKITIAAAFGIFNPVQRKACNHVRAVRNAFAHSIKVIGFDTPEVAKECAHLDPQKLAPPDTVFQGETNDAREHFRVSCLLLSNHLMQRIQHMVQMRKAAGIWPDK